MTPHPLDDPMPPADASEIRRLLLFCGSRSGADPCHAGTAAAIGRLVAERGVTLVYGGGSLGLMGEAGRAAIAAGGTVQGVIPRFLKDLEVAEPLCRDMAVVGSLHARKALMFERADAVLALPGGLGTLEELVEILSWRHLRLHAKPVWLLGDNAFWSPFIALIDHMLGSGFVGPNCHAVLEQLESVDALAARLPAA